MAMSVVVWDGRLHTRGLLALRVRLRRVWPARGERRHRECQESRRTSTVTRAQEKRKARVRRLRESRERGGFRGRCSAAQRPRKVGGKQGLAGGGDVEAEGKAVDGPVSDSEHGRRRRRSRDDGGWAAAIGEPARGAPPGSRQGAMGRAVGKPGTRATGVGVLGKYREDCDWEPWPGQSARHCRWLACPWSLKASLV